MIEFSHVTKSYPTGEIVLDDISFIVSPGEFLVITGKSGVGKTTIGRLLIRDAAPTSGKVIIDGEDLTKMNPNKVPTLRRKIGFIFQDYKIILDKTVAENINFALEIAGTPKDKIKEKIDNLLTVVGIPGKGDLFPVQLSGGELQRASIARAIAADPPFLFADEPTGNLDKETSLEIFDLLKTINKSGTTIIMATHDVTLIEYHEARHLHLENGKIISDTDNRVPKKVSTKETPAPVVVEETPEEKTPTPKVKRKKLKIKKHKKDQ